MFVVNLVLLFKNHAKLTVKLWNNSSLVEVPLYSLW